MEIFTKKHQHFYIYVEWKNGSKAADIRQKLVNAGGEGVLSLSAIRRWIDAFNHGKINFKDEPRSGRPREATTTHTVNKITEIVNRDPNINIRKISESIGVSIERVSHILHEELGLKKICKKWIPHVLNEENKLKRVEYSKIILETLNKGYENIITGDETWIHCYTLPSKEDNKVWLPKGANRPQIVRTAKNSKKFMFPFFSIIKVLSPL